MNVILSYSLIKCHTDCEHFFITFTLTSRKSKIKLRTKYLILLHVRSFCLYMPTVIEVFEANIGLLFELILSSGNIYIVTSLLFALSSSTFSNIPWFFQSEKFKTNYQSDFTNLPHHFTSSMIRILDNYYNNSFLLDYIETQ